MCVNVCEVHTYNYVYVVNIVCAEGTYIYTYTHVHTYNSHTYIFITHIRLTHICMYTSHAQLHDIKMRNTVIFWQALIALDALFLLLTFLVEMLCMYMYFHFIVVRNET